MRGHLRRRGAKSWAIVLDLGRSMEGKRRQKWHSFQGTRKQAERELARLVHSFESGAYVEPTSLSVADYLRQWLKGHARFNISGKTFERYEEIIEKHLIPSLGPLSLPRLQPLHIQGYYAAAREHGRTDGRGGLSTQTVLHHHRILREALQQAVRWQILVRNPAEAVDPPRPDPRIATTASEEETVKLLEGLKWTRVYLPVLLAVTTGMRRGEILGLAWEDVDLDAATVSVRRTLEETTSGLSMKTPKTEKSRRLITLPHITVKALRAHRAEQAKIRLALGGGYFDLGLVVTRAEGLPLRPSDISKSFRAAAKRIGVGIRFHDLRHSHASQLLKQGVHPKVVSERLGHSTVGVTLDVYSHVLPGIQAEAARGVDEALRAAMRKVKKGAARPA